MNQQRRVAIVGMLVLVGCWALEKRCAAQTPHPAVARIIVPEADGIAYGSGTLVDVREGYGLVATNWHVVRDATGKIEVQFPGGFRSEALPLKLDQDWDLAALVIWQPPVSPAPIARHAPRPGEPLTICGYGQGPYRAVTGHCTEYYSPKIGLPHELVELNVEARQGDSGGPIFNQRGELAGVLFGSGEGTTMGAFGGRVNWFLSTLASDIGTYTPQYPKPVTPPYTAPATPRPAQVAPQPQVAPPPPAVEVLAPAPAEPLATAATPPAASETFTPWQANTTPATTAATPPAINATSPLLPATPLTPSTWFEDIKSLFALIGVLAVLMAVVKTIT